MENFDNSKEYYSIDLLHIIKVLWRRVWVIILAGILAASIAFSIASFVIAPKYSSSIMLYVNNSSFSLGNTSFSISSSEISAAQSLVKTYIVLLRNRTTLEKVIEKAGVSYTYRELDALLEAESVNETEVFRIKVTTEDPYESAKITNSIAEVLPGRVSEVIDGASMEIVDSAIPNLQKVSPSITRYTAVGLILGVLASVLFLTVLALMDDTIHDDEYISQNYKYPILAKIPDLLGGGSSKEYKYKYNYYSQNKNK